MNYADKDRIITEFLNELNDFCKTLESKDIKTEMSIDKHISISHKNKLNGTGNTVNFDKLFKNKDTYNYINSLKEHLIHISNPHTFDFNKIQEKNINLELSDELKKCITNFFDNKINDEKKELKKRLNNLDNGAIEHAEKLKKVADKKNK